MCLSVKPMGLIVSRAHVVETTGGRAMCFIVNQQAHYFHTFMCERSSTPKPLLRSSTYAGAKIYAQAHAKSLFYVKIYAQAHAAYAQAHGCATPAMCFTVRTSSSIVSGGLISKRWGNQKASRMHASATGQGSTRQPPFAYSGFRYNVWG